MAWTGAPLEAAEKASPVAVMTVQSIDGAIENVRYLLTLAGQGESAKQIEALLGQVTSGKRFQGIDTQKPLGAFIAKLGEALDNPPLVVFVPLTNQDEFIDLLKQVGMEPSKPEKDVYTVDTPLGVSLALRFANNHAYFAMNADTLQGDLPDPKTFVPKSHLNSIIAATFKIDQMTPETRKQALQQVQAQFDADKPKKDEESDEQHAVRLALLKGMREISNSVVRDAEQVSFSFNVDQKEGNIAADLMMVAKPGSKLAEKIQDLGPAQPIAPVHVEVSVGKLALLLLPDESDGKVGDIRKLFAGEDKGKDKVRISLYGGDAMHIRFDVNAQVVKLFAALMPQEQR